MSLFDLDILIKLVEPTQNRYCVCSQNVPENLELPARTLFLTMLAKSYMQRLMTCPTLT